MKLLVNERKNNMVNIANTMAIISMGGGATSRRQSICGLQTKTVCFLNI